MAIGDVEVIMASASTSGGCLSTKIQGYKYTNPARVMCLKAGFIPVHGVKVSLNECNTDEQ